MKVMTSYVDKYFFIDISGHSVDVFKLFNMNENSWRKTQNRGNGFFVSIKMYYLLAEYFENGSFIIGSQKAYLQSKSDVIAYFYY